MSKRRIVALRSYDTARFDAVVRVFEEYAVVREGSSGNSGIAIESEAKNPSSDMMFIQDGAEKRT